MLATKETTPRTPQTLFSLQQSINFGGILLVHLPRPFFLEEIAFKH